MPYGPSSPCHCNNESQQGFRRNTRSRERPSSNPNRFIEKEKNKREKGRPLKERRSIEELLGICSGWVGGEKQKKGERKKEGGAGARFSNQSLPIPYWKI
ncbi:hypothetical protein P8452_52973 [Trifolium repens]|nr:hypothetical protein P8452_52973 [Trifolium repens]